MSDRPGDLDLLVPFHVNGTLSPDEAAAVQAWLDADDMALSDVEALAAIRAAMQADLVCSPGEFGLDRLLREVDRPAEIGAGAVARPEGAAVITPPTASGAMSGPSSGADSGTDTPGLPQATAAPSAPAVPAPSASVPLPAPPVQPVQVGAPVPRPANLLHRPGVWQAVAALALAALLGQMLLAPGPLTPPDPAFRLAGGGDDTAPGRAVLTVAFAPGATEAAIRALLVALDADITAGPSALGLYRLGVADPDAAAAALRAAADIVDSVQHADD
jgi:hypothetical protein